MTTSSPWLPTWDGAAYAANTGHHRAHDGAFLTGLPARPTDRLLDVGCGSGDFTATLASLVPGGHVVGLDPQPSMLDQARGVAGPNQSFVPGVAQDLVGALAAAGVEAGFDGVLSRAALQWVPIGDHPAVLAGVHAVLRPGGWFRLEMGGHGNIGPMAAHLDAVAARYGGVRPPWAFPDAGWYLEQLERSGFDHSAGWVRTVAQRRPFDAASLVGWLRTQGFTGYLPSIAPADHDAFRAEVESRLDELRRHDGSFDQTFVRLDVLAHRA
jgi:trans-aconitate methyltransferase